MYLIVYAYCFMRLDDDQWPEVFLKALKKDGVVVFQAYTAGKRVTVAEQVARWKGFRLMRVADLDGAWWTTIGRRP